jgi:hypothetical protein
MFFLAKVEVENKRGSFRMPFRRHIQWAAKVLRAAAEKCFFENSNISGPTHHIAVLLTVLDSSCSVVLGVKITAYYLKN